MKITCLISAFISGLWYRLHSYAHMPRKISERLQYYGRNYYATQTNYKNIGIIIPTVFLPFVDSERNWFI